MAPRIARLDPNFMQWFLSCKECGPSCERVLDTGVRWAGTSCTRVSNRNSLQRLISEPVYTAKPPRMFFAISSHQGTRREFRAISALGYFQPAEIE